MMYILSLIPVILVNINSITTTEGGGLEYVSHRRSFEGAQKYCQSVYGTDLASIVDSDRNNAISAIGGESDDQAWFGLSSTFTGRRWEFINDDICPVNPEARARCVSFWRQSPNARTRPRPRCIGTPRGGYECAYFDASDNIIDNDIDCTTPKPFFCEAPESLPSYNPGQYVLISGGVSGEGMSFEEAQAKCESEYGTDLATVITESDASAAAKLINPVGNQWPFAIIGLHDIGVEGEYEWIDGTPCTTTDGKCTDLFNVLGDGFGGGNNENNIGDIDSISNADCISLNTAVVDDTVYDGSNFFEMGCENPNGVEWNILCNAPKEQVVPSYNPGTYVFISGGDFGDGLSFEEAQAKCESEYGTDLATIVTESDALAAGQVMTDNIAEGGWPFAIIGLNDMDIEGQYAWKDGTECTVNDNGKCIADLFDIGYYDIDDVDDFSTNAGADCIVFNPNNNGALLDGSNFFEMECANPLGVEHNILCNGPSI